MAVFKCKMCGGNLEIGENQSVATCEYCNTQQTLPKFDDDRKISLFIRANHLRFNCEFDKAAGIYESIVTEYPDEAEAYWGLVLCKYGIEYVDDMNDRKIPTCHRTVPLSVMDDEDFCLACDYADIISKNVYRNEAKVIDSIQKKILQIAATEKPYDIFICYKETDDNTSARTEDSSIAQDLYTALTEKGYKVFYARNSLRRVAGTEYEPYIYAALSSAKIMLVIGTKYEYYDAVWVKNEWSRFISMMGDDSSKALIPCYKNMDAYDMPKEFKNMQGLDIGEITFFDSLISNINRFLTKEKTIINESVNVKTDNKNREIAFEDGYYIGEAVADQPNGFGTRVWNDNTKYEGTWRFGKKNGQGIYCYSNGDRFEGEYKNDEPYNGYGRTDYNDGYYIGQLVNGKRIGPAVVIYANGDKIKGVYKDDELNGPAVVTYANGDKFEGEYKDDEPYNGYGRKDYSDGYYIGQLVNGKCEGKGFFIRNNGDKFEGTYINDELNGPVLVTYANGDRFEGEYRNDKPYNGYGRKDYSDGYYIGQFLNGKCEGKGTLYRNDGTKTEGKFKNDKLLSKGCYIATAVYGSYECPQVWTLRRYRDYTLAKSWYGRAFIRIYYAISPTLVRWVGHTDWFKKIWKKKLDHMVEKLQSEGYKSTPYEDKKW